MRGSGLFVFFLSAQKATGVRGLVLLRARPPPSPVVHLSILDPHSSSLALEVQHDLQGYLILIPKSYGQDVTRFVG